MLHFLAQNKRFKILHLSEIYYILRHACVHHVGRLPGKVSRICHHTSDVSSLHQFSSISYYIKRLISNPTQNTPSCTWRTCATCVQLPIQHMAVTSHFIRVSFLLYSLE